MNNDLENNRPTLSTPINEARSTIFYMRSDTQSEILKLCENGDIFVKGKLIENDKEVVDAMREFLSGQGFNFTR